MTNTLDKDFFLNVIKEELSLRLNRKPPFNVFVNESDLQLFLGLNLQKQFPYSDIEFETMLDSVKKVDIVMTYNTIKYPIEIKYSAFKNNKCIAGTEDINICRCSFLEDIMRVEKICSGSDIQKGYCIFLTNDEDLFKKNEQDDKLSKTEELQIFSGRKIKSGEKLNYIGCNDNLKKEYCFKNDYEFQWVSVSDKSQEIEEFKLLVVEV